MLKYILNFFSVILLLSFLSCGNDKSDVATDSSKNIDRNNFKWSESISKDNLPDFPVKGFINGKEVKIIYINFEHWRGSGDNVLNFSTANPTQRCGFVENDSAFHLTKLSGDFTKGVFVKETFDKSIDGYIADFHTFGEDGPKKISVPWNCALDITEINDKVVKGKIAICFKDDKKSWLAGSFEATVCNN